VRAAALRDAETLLTAGFSGLMVENYGDSPFFPGEVPPITVAAMTRVAAELRQLLPADGWLGINVLRNDARAALAIARAVGAQGLRVNVHNGARVTDQGIVLGQAHETLRLRAAWGADDVVILADVDVKHSAPLGQPREAGEEVSDLIERGGADVVIVSGARTGLPVDAGRLRELRGRCPGARLAVGSGATAETVSGLLQVVDHVIVGTATKEGGRTEAPVDPGAARRFVEAAARRV
jgi:membrane complex biogenesis BtpA family protein